jgi:hypothetical protein
MARDARRAQRGAATRALCLVAAMGTSVDEDLSALESAVRRMIET